MEKRNAKISFNKSGRGTLTPRATLPISWVKQMGLSEELREVELVFEDNKIIIQKPQ